MEDKDDQECGMLPQPMTADLCLNQMSIDALHSNLRVYTKGMSSADTVSPIVGIQRKYQMYGNYSELPITNRNVFQSASFNSTTCACTNMVKEAHYTVYYSPLDTDATVFTIANITLDVVYGDVRPSTCQ